MRDIDLTVTFCAPGSTLRSGQGQAAVLRSLPASFQIPSLALSFVLPDDTAVNHGVYRAFLYSTL